MSIAGTAQDAVRQMDPDLAITEVWSMPAVLADSLWKPRFAAVLIGVFAAIAAVLTAAGIYAVFSYLISGRTHEMGVRMALGAEWRQIVGLVLHSVLRVTGIGISAGVAVSLLIARVLNTQFNAARPNDVVTVAGAAAFLAAVAFTASLRPAIRATRVDPLQALRQE